MGMIGSAEPPGSGRARRRRRAPAARATWVRPLLAAAALGVPMAVTAGLVPARSELPNATVALVLAAVVSLLAAGGGRLAAAVAAVSAALSFDVAFTRPYGSVSISRSQDVETTGLLLVVGLVVGELAARNRAHRRLMAQTSHDLGRIHGVAEMVAAGSPTDQIIVAVGSELRDMLGLRSCFFDAAFADPPGPFIERHGGVSWGALRWGFTTMGLPAREVTLVVEQQGRPLGRYVLLAEPGTRVTEDQLVAAVALADQAGAALALGAQSP